MKEQGFHNLEIVHQDASVKYNMLFDTLNASKFQRIGTVHKNKVISLNIEIINYLRCVLLILQVELDAFLLHNSSNIAIKQGNILRDNIIETYFDPDIYKDIRTLQRYKQMIKINDDEFVAG